MNMTIRFVDENGNDYDTTEYISGPYGDTGIFTGPKVCFTTYVPYMFTRGIFRHLGKINFQC